MKIFRWQVWKDTYGVIAVNHWQNTASNWRMKHSRRTVNSVDYLPRFRFIDNQLHHNVAVY